MRQAFAGMIQKAENGILIPQSSIIQAATGNICRRADHGKTLTPVKMGLAQYITPEDGMSSDEVARVMRDMRDVYHSSDLPNGLQVFKSKGDREAFLEVAIEEGRSYIHRSGQVEEIFGRLVGLICQECGDLRIEDA